MILISSSKRKAEELATLAKQGEISTNNLGLTADELIKFGNVLQKSF